MMEQTTTIHSAESFPSRPAALPLVRRFVRESARPVQSDAEAVDDLVLAVSEACANSVKHSRGDELQVRLLVSEENVIVEVQDQGEFDAGAGALEEPEARGRGFAIMAALADELHVRKGTTHRPGTLVRVIKRTRPTTSFA